ncbi:hypothetical protein ABZ744_12885 [Micromonospora chersina]|uniref:hypothetical protein n=1 Tax=Micromonospora chersina TaxID=47854 RepID=UPI0033EACD29
MTNTNRPAGVAGILFNVGLGVVFVLGLAFTAFMISDSWGTGYAIFNGTVGVLVCLLALLRGVDRFRTAVAGVGLAAVAVVVSLVADLPQEPGPITGLALAVLVGSALRALPFQTAAAIGAGGLLVVVGSYLSALDNQNGFSAVTVLDALGWLAAVAAGLTLRGSDARTGVAPATAAWTPSARAR